MDQIRDPFRHVVSQYLSLQDLLQLCKTNREWRDFCQDNETWDYLLKRDFNITVQDRPHLHYEAKYRITQWEKLVDKAISEQERIEENTILTKDQKDIQIAAILQVPFLAMMDLAAWNLVSEENFPNLSISMDIPQFDNLGYLFLRRVMSLYYSQPYSLMQNRRYPVYCQLEKMYHFHVVDLMMARGSHFCTKILSDEKLGREFVSIIKWFDLIPFTFEYMMNQLDSCRDPVYMTTSHGFEKILSSFRDHPSNDLLLQHIDIGIPPVVL